MTKKLSIKQLLELTRKEQSDYLAMLQDKGAGQTAEYDHEPEPTRRAAVKVLDVPHKTRH